MRRPLLMVLLFFCTSNLSAQSFQKIYNYGSVHDVILFPDSSGYLFTGDAETNTNDRNFLIKTNLYGNRLWGKFYRDFIEFYSWGNVIVPANGGFYLGGMTLNDTISNQEISFSFIDTSGSLQWSKRFGSILEDDEVFSMITSDSSFLLCGYTKGYGAGLSDALLIKTDFSGAIQWSETFGTAGNELGKAIVKNENGYFIFSEVEDASGNQDIVIINTDTAGNVIGQKRLLENNGAFLHSEFIGQVIKTDQQYVLVGTATGLSADSSNSFVIQMDSLLNVLNAAWISGGKSRANTVTITGNDSWLIGGSIDVGSGKSNALILQTDSLLQNLSTQMMGDSTLGSVNKLRVLNDSTVLMAGEMTQRPQINPHLFLMNYYASIASCNLYNRTFALEPLSVQFIAETPFSSQFVACHITNAFVVTSNLNQADTNFCDVVKIESLADPADVIGVFPNPAVNEISISSAEPVASVRIFDVTGKEVAQFRQQVLHIDLPAGVYSVSIETISRRHFVQKLIVR